VQDTVEFIPDWKLTLGVRRDHLDADYLSSMGTTLANASSELKFSESSYRAGLSWQPTDSVHYYVSYTDSFSPTADLYQLSQVEREAERSDTYEIGAKWLFLDGDLAFRTALYSATKDWERNTDLEATAAILTRKRRTNGLEIEVAGKLTDKWEMFGGVSLMDAKILKVATNSDGNDVGTAPDLGDSRFEGERPRNTPSATFNLWTTYKLPGNWKVGGGVEAKGERYGYNPQQQASQTSVAGGVFENGSFKPNTLPGYARVDALVAYEAQRWAVRLNVKNLLDKKYYDALYDNGAFSVPGNRRQAIVTTEFKF
jgi:catecholate siderophore receptor